jgi:hypothetical protein
MAIHPSRHITADTNYLEMKTEYDRLLRDEPGLADGMAAKAAKARQAKPDSGGPVGGMLDYLVQARPEQKKPAGIVCRGVLGMAVSCALGAEEDPANRVIVDLRDQTLARFVDESKADKVYIAYGAAYFPGFFAALQRRDPKFALCSVKGVRPTTLPDEPNLAPSAVTGRRREPPAAPAASTRAARRPDLLQQHLDAALEPRIAPRRQGGRIGGHRDVGHDLPVLEESAVAPLEAQLRHAEVQPLAEPGLPQHGGAGAKHALAQQRADLQLLVQRREHRAVGVASGVGDRRARPRPA